MIDCDYTLGSFMDDGEVAFADDCFEGFVSQAPHDPLPQLFSLFGVRSSRAIRGCYFLIRQGEMGPRKALKNGMLGSEENSSNLAQ